MCDRTVFPVIDLPRTGRNILRLRRQAGLTVRELQDYFGFEYPQAIYKWQHGECLPSVDNLLALARVLQVSMEDLLVHEDREVSVFSRLCGRVLSTTGLMTNAPAPVILYPSTGGTAFPGEEVRQRTDFVNADLPAGHSRRIQQRCQRVQRKYVRLRPGRVTPRTLRPRTVPKGVRSPMERLTEK